MCVCVCKCVCMGVVVQINTSHLHMLIILNTMSYREFKNITFCNFTSYIHNMNTHTFIHTRTYPQYIATCTHTYLYRQCALLEAIMITGVAFNLLFINCKEAI